MGLCSSKVRAEHFLGQGQSSTATTEALVEVGSLCVNAAANTYAKPIRFFDIYRTLCNPLYPVISDFDEFEAAVVVYIDDAASYRLRAELEGLKGAAFELRLSWLALLSATIATGIQYSDMKPGERRVLIEGFSKLNIWEFLALLTMVQLRAPCNC
jgi:hypothetical protein